MGIERSLQQPTSTVSTPADPPVGGFVVTPHDTNQLNNGTVNVVARALTVGVVGTLKVTFKDGTIATLPAVNMIAGVQMSMQVTHVWQTGTTATDIFAWY